MMKQDTRGAVSARTAVALIVGITVVALIAAFLAPVAINQFEGNTTTTLTQDEGTAYEVNGALNATVTGTTVSTTDTATIELNDTRVSGTTSNTIDNGTTTDYDMNGGTVTVGVEDVDDSPTPNQATVNHTYDNDYAFGGAATALWGILGMIIVLAVVLIIIFRALDLSL